MERKQPTGIKGEGEWNRCAGGVLSEHADAVLVGVVVGSGGRALSAAVVSAVVVSAGSRAAVVVGVMSRAGGAVAVRLVSLFSVLFEPLEGHSVPSPQTPN